MKQQLLLGSFFMANAALAADGVSVSGFVDAQYQWAKFDKKLTALGVVENTNTFAVPDGAIYLEAKSGRTEVFVDMPFHASDSSSDFLTFEEKGQAWVGVNYDSGLNWKVGQFDSFIGYEASDGNELVFTGGGLLAEQAPSVHRGLDVGYSLNEELSLGFVVANPHINQTAGGDMEHGNPDVGVYVGANFDPAWVKVGALFGKDTAADETSWIVHAQGGFKVAQLDVVLEALMDKDDALTLGADETGLGLGAHFMYALDDALQLSTRIEWYKVASNKVWGWTVGPQYKASEALTLKLDYSLAMTQGALETTSHGVNVAAVHSF